MKKMCIGFLIICLLFVTACSHKNNIKTDSLDNSPQSESIEDTSESFSESTEFDSDTTESTDISDMTTVPNSSTPTANPTKNAGTVNKSGNQTTAAAPINTSKKAETPVSNILSPAKNQNSSSNASSSPQSSVTTTTTNQQSEGYVFSMKATIKNWVADGNIVYTITSSPNELWVLNVATMKTITTIDLPGSPAEIQLDNDQILISYPTLQSIIYYNKSNFEETKSIDLPHVVSSFAIYNGYVYYSEDDQWCSIFRTNLSDTTQTATIGTYYYFPKLLINKNDNLLYVIESGTTGSKVHYFNLSDLKLQSETSGYGYSNITRYAYFDGQYLYAMNFKIDKTNADHIVGEYIYNKDYWDGVTFANDKYIITENALYSKDTLEQLLVFKSSFKNSLITSNNTLLLYNNEDLYILPV